MVRKSLVLRYFEINPTPMLIRRILSSALLGAAIAAPAAPIEASVEPDGQGGGVLEAPRDELAAPERARIASAIAQSRARLIAEGKLSRYHAKSLTNFKWPLRSAAGRTDFAYHGISNFVDEDPAYPSHVKDYFCGARSYDLASGYNHAGTDIFLWPFSWKKMDDEDVVIVAGAPGIILYKSDGHFDRSCAMNNNTWNAVYVEHADGSVAWYGHMKNGSPTVKAVGETVKAGEYLGSVGSSGSSTGPHLHLELYDAADVLVDPWLGACNGMSKQVTWEVQRPYRDSAVNALTIGDAAPTFPACSNPETSGAVDIVTPGTRVYFTMYLRDQVTGSPASMRVLRPNGSVYATQTSGDNTYNASYWYWYYDAFPNLPGTWTFEATIAGNTVTKTFQVGGAAAYGAPASITALAGSAQSTPPGADFAAPLRVQVLDSLARNVKGAKVVFTTPSSGATAILESRTAITDASGIASVAAIANATAGSYVVTASVAGAAIPRRSRCRTPWRRIRRASRTSRRACRCSPATT
jgi:murein DD-endopeptidase MepM/ murein hydrolase activator NlpD